MRKLAILGVSALLIAAAASGCSSDDDNPGSESGGSSGSGGSDAGAPSSSGATGGSGAVNAGGSSGAPSGEGGAGATPPTNEAGAAGAGTPGPVSCDDVYAERSGGRKPIPNDDGDITIDVLTADTIWTLDGRLFVNSGKSLTIEPCTLIEATGKPNAGSLFIMAGAKIHAVGTPDAPIVFTNESHEFDAGAPWGGLVLLGRAPIAPAANGKSTPRIYEGMNDPRAAYGSTNAADSSGEVQYVRIEFGGDLITQDKEINGLTLAGVGSGTKLDHIMVKDQLDDCFEFFGGTVNASHLICQNSGDDMFDTDEGYKGHLQYLFGRNLVDGGSGDPNGLEWDGNQLLLTAPADTLGTPQASNVTLCGTTTANTGYGAVLRRSLGEGTLVQNAIVTGFNFGLDTRDTVGTNAAPLLGWTNSAFFGQSTADLGPVEVLGEASDDDGGFDEDAWIEEADNANTVGEAPAGFDCYAEVPTPPSTPVEGATPGAGFDDEGTFVGAFGTENWATGSWVDWSE